MKSRWLAAARWGGLAALVVWIASPLMHGDSAAMRLDMLAVGDGSCYAVRGGGSTILFDAGSSSNLDAGRRTIIPALRRLGVQSIDAIIISHADVDHFSAVLELADEFDVGAVHVTPQFISAAENDASGLAAFVLDSLTQRRVAVRRIGAGEEVQFGSMVWTWLHPPGDAEFARDNDSSMVVRIKTGDGSVLLCGDIQQQAIELLLRTGTDVKADVLELPHHGSYIEESVEFVKAVDPKVVVQSTGWMRWQRDRWANDLSNRQRLVTARDGACWVEISPEGEIRTGRFVNDKVGAAVGESP